MHGNGLSACVFCVHRLHLGECSRRECCVVKSTMAHSMSGVFSVLMLRSPFHLFGEQCCVCMCELHGDHVHAQDNSSTDQTCCNTASAGLAVRKVGYMMETLSSFDSKGKCCNYSVQECHRPFADRGSLMIISSFVT